MIQPQEAATALKEIARAEQHSGQAYHYQKASAHLFLWGAIWIVGYAATYFRPRWYGIWLILTVAGIIGSFWISWRAAAGRSQSSFGWRYAASFIAVFLFIEALFAILPPKSGLQVDAFFPLLVALCYVLLGLWMRATRMAVLGVALGALTVGGYFWLPQHFLLWMAGVGGGALILGGFWLRKV
ncbi:MAG: hypothetical protein WA876_14235 [Candidatus Acidiferrales bacterium]